MSEQSFWRLRTTTVLLSILPLSFIFVMLLFVKNISHFFSVWDKDVQVSIFMKEMASTQDVLEIKKILSTDERVKNFEYFDQERSFNEFKQHMPDLLEESFADDQLFQLMPISFQVSLKKLEDSKVLQSVLKNKAGVQNVYVSEDFFDKYLKLRTGVNFLSFVIAGIMLIFLALIIHHSIQQMIFLKSEEISILEMLGATPKFIRRPLLIEVISIHIFACAVSFCVCLVAYFGFYKLISRQFDFLNLHRQIVFLNGFEILIIIAVPLCVAVLSTLLSLKRIGSGWSYAKA